MYAPTVKLAGRAPSFSAFRNTIPGRKVNPLEYQKEIGLDWEVSKEELSFNMVETLGLESLRAVVRSDNRSAVGVVGMDYAPVQNTEMFQFLSDLGEFDLEMEMVAGGALGKGETVWTMAKVPSLGIELGNDTLESFLFMSNGHAGNRNLAISFYTLRKRCQNGLHSLTQVKGKTVIGDGWKLKHTSGISERLAQAEGIVHSIVRDRAITLDTFRRMADTPATWETVEAIATAVYGPVPVKKEGKADKAHTIASNRMNDLRAIWNSPTSKGIDTEGSVFTALNAVTEWAEHESITRSGNYTQDESRLIGNYLGGTASNFKEEAFTYALSLI